MRTTAAPRAQATNGSARRPRVAVSASQLVVDHIRKQILIGQLLPGTHLDEMRLCEEQGVSRNTLREAFRVLAHDRLVQHQPNRGVFVRVIESVEARQVYGVRRMLEVGSLREAALVPPTQVESRMPRVQQAVVRAERAREAGDWATVGTMNGEFHLALTALAGNSVTDRLMSTLITEVRLVFLSAGTAERVHERYIDANRGLFGLVRAHQFARAALAVESYLLDAEEHLIKG